MSTTIHREPHQQQDRIERLERATTRLEQLVERLLALGSRMATTEDRLDRQRRPYGDGARH